MGRTDPEIFISVDVEAAGPIPGRYSLLSIGACVVGVPSSRFYVEIRPINRRMHPDVAQVLGRTLRSFEQGGHRPRQAMESFRRWVHSVAGKSPVFVGLNAPFDWSFVNWYFHTYTGANPFGFAALDIKAYYMGQTGCAWTQATSTRIARDLGLSSTHRHHALADAVEQSDFFAGLLARSKAARRATDE